MSTEQTSSPSRGLAGTNLPEPVLIERQGDVLTFTLNRPEAGNEVSGAMFDAMLAELREEAVAPRARVLRLRAAGPQFCTGRERAASDVAAFRREAARLIGLKQALRATSLITIAEVQGDAFGFGFGLAILCDFALVVQSAALAFPEMRGGLAPAAILAYVGEYALPRDLFPLVLFGEPISPERALEVKLISQVVSDVASLERAANDLTARILKLDASATRTCKELFHTMLQGSFETNCRLAVDALAVGGAVTKGL